MATRSKTLHPDSLAFTRRQFVHAGVAAGAALALGLPRISRSAQVPPGKITVTKGPGLTVHTYTAPEVGWLVNSHIIELPKQLLIVDAQYLLPCGQELAQYAKSLKKPITRVYITHYHPDHHLGASALDAPLFALPDVKAKIDSIGERLAAEERAKFPADSGMIADHARHIDNIATLGTEVLDGVSLELRPIEHAETEIALAIAVPSERMMITQDLVYNRVHLFLGERRFSGWRQALMEYRALSFDKIFPGHGLPGDARLYDANIAYLDFAEAQLPLSKDGDDFKARILKRYPRYGGLALLDHEKRFLFKPA
jgi:glyoxylase-like metal-dependent hydrolase (beta-lactamase superfamily II)